MKKRVPRKTLGVAVILAVLFFSPSRVDAATSVYLSPASGTVGNTLTVGIGINTGGDAINGIEMTVNYTGPVTYTSSSAGDIGCAPSVQETAPGSLLLLCFIAPGQTHTGTGTVGSLTFTASTSGTVSITLADVDVAGSTAGTATGGTYTVGVAGLPETGIFSDYPVVFLGACVLIIGFLMVFVPHRYASYVYSRVADRDLHRKIKYEKDVVSRAE